MRFPSPTKTLLRYRNHLRRSSAIQQGLLNLSIFLLSLFLLSIVTYFVVQDSLVSRLDANLAQRMGVLLERVSTEGWDEQAQYRKRDQVMQGKDFFLVFPKGDLSQRSNRVFRKQGFNNSEFEHYQSDDDDQPYRILVEHRDGLVFVVAENNDNDQEVLEIVLSAFMINGLIALILTALLVVYLANRSHKQIRQIERVLRYASQGDLQQRIGPTDKNNDLAHVSQQIDTMLSRLETSMAATADISANIAHELKTPVSRLRHDLITALDQHEQGKSVEASLNDAYDESSYITETFDALLRISQIEGGARRSNFAELDLRNIINTVMDIYEEVAEDAGMTLALAQSMNAQSDQSMTIQGDKELLVQMMANLIENAIRYCPQGTQIVIGCVSHDDEIALSVSDNGSGIPLEEHEQVFQRLYRLDKSRSDKRGTGLGLSLVKAIIELHDATIKLEDNKPGLKVAMRFSRQMMSNFGVA